ncbi:hypothetical protein OIDMADRAFT_175080 [Oidiodendron maius Zn]|uniref:Protein ROT1 n=1 Tax=Oidiodendron maius (strain Zn) TaxID=913774 RepID=A0A0C3E1P4_OIDMZ|nr:hypothetical protein OIDMADRAFT_175080 [Oidiodendron maius Zn]
MAQFTQPLVTIVAFLSCIVKAQIPPSLVGTWSTKSGKVLTGPGFYNPVNDSFIEPRRTGISYSFTSDGYYEEAYYRAISNPTTPNCPRAILQFQHGTFISNSDGSLTLTPFGVDGRQLLSDPCGGSGSKGVASYTRYNQSESMQKWQVYSDPYTKLTRLDLYKFDGSPVNPMFLAYSPPQMLPTITMNPTSAPSVTGNTKRGSSDEMDLPLNKHAGHIKHRIEQHSLLHWVDLNILWWAGIGMTVFGGAAYLMCNDSVL